MEQKKGNRPSRPSLLFHLTSEEVSGLAEKSFLRGMHIRLGNMLMAGLWIYETGAVLGRARRDQLPALAKMICRPGEESQFCDHARDFAGER